MRGLKSGLTLVFAIVFFAHVSFAWVRFREPLSRRNFLNQTLIEKLQNCAEKEEHECGLCGEGPGEVETNGIPTENYTVIDPDVRVLAVELGFRSGLNGFLEFRVCNVTDNSTRDAIMCNATTPLLIGADEQWYPALNQTSAKSRFRLPRGLLCERCVLQVKYTPGSNSTMKDFRFYDCALLNITYPTKVITKSILTTRAFHYNEEFPHDPLITETRHGSTELRSANMHNVHDRNALRTMNGTVNIGQVRKGRARFNTGAENIKSGVRATDASAYDDALRRTNNQSHIKQGVKESINKVESVKSNRQSSNQVNIYYNQGVISSLDGTANILRSSNITRNVKEGQQRITTIEADKSRNGLASLSNTLTIDPSGNTDVNVKQSVAEKFNNDKTVVVSTKLYNYSQTEDNVVPASSDSVARITTIDIKSNTRHAFGNDEKVIHQTNSAETRKTKGAHNPFTTLNNDNVITNIADATSITVTDETGNIEKHSFTIHGVNLESRKVHDTLSDTNDISNVDNNLEIMSKNSDLKNGVQTMIEASGVETSNVQNQNVFTTRILNEKSNNITTAQGETTTGAQEDINNNESLGYYDYAYYYYNDTVAGNDSYIYYEDTVNINNETKSNVTDRLVAATSTKNLNNSIKGGGVTSGTKIISSSSQSNASFAVNNVDISNSFIDMSTFSDQIYKEKQGVHNSQNKISSQEEIFNKDVNANKTNILRTVAEGQDLFSQVTQFENRDVTGIEIYATNKASSLTHALPTDNTKDHVNLTLIAVDTSSNQVKSLDLKIANIMGIHSDKDANSINQRIVLVPKTIVVLPERTNTNEVEKNITEEEKNQTADTHAKSNRTQTDLNEIKHSGKFRSTDEVAERPKSNISPPTSIINKTQINAFEKSMGWTDFTVKEDHITRQNSSLTNVSMGNVTSSKRNIDKQTANDLTNSSSINYDYDVSRDSSFPETSKKLVYATSAADRKPIYALEDEIKSIHVNGNDTGSGLVKKSSISFTNNAQFQNKDLNRIRFLENVELSSDTSNTFSSTNFSVHTGVHNADFANSGYKVFDLTDTVNDNSNKKTNSEHRLSSEHLPTGKDKDTISNYEINYSDNNKIKSRIFSENIEKVSAKTDNETQFVLNRIKNDHFDTSHSNYSPVKRNSVERSAFPGRIIAVNPEATRMVSTEKQTMSKENKLKQNKMRNQIDNIETMTNTFAEISDNPNRPFFVIETASTPVSETMTDASSKSASIRNNIKKASIRNKPFDVSTRPYDKYLGVVSTARSTENEGSSFVKIVNYTDITSDSVVPAPKLDISSISNIISDKQTRTESVLMSIFTSTPLPTVTNNIPSEVSTSVSNKFNSQSGFDNTISFSNLNFFADSETRVDRLGGVPVLFGKGNIGSNQQTHWSDILSSANKNETNGNSYFDTTNMLNIVHNQLFDQSSSQISDTKITGLVVPFGNPQFDLDSKGLFTDTTSLADGFTLTNNDKSPDAAGFQGGKTIVWQSMQLSNISSLQNKPNIGRNVNLPQSNIGRNVKLPQSNIGRNVNLLQSNFGRNVNLPQSNIGRNVNLPQYTYNISSYNNNVSTEMVNISSNIDLNPITTEKQERQLDSVISTSSHEVNFVKNNHDTGNTNSLATFAHNNVNTAKSSIPIIEDGKRFLDDVPRIFTITAVERKIPKETIIISTDVSNVGIIDSSNNETLVTMEIGNKDKGTKRNIIDEGAPAKKESLDFSGNVITQINSIRNMDLERRTIVKENVSLANSVLKSKTIGQLDISINGDAGKNNILAAKDVNRKSIDIKGNAPNIMPPIDVKQSARGILKRVNILNDQNQRKRSFGQILLTPRRNITLFNPHQKTVDYDIRIANTPSEEIGKVNTVNSIYKMFSASPVQEASSSNLSLTTIWDINRGNTDMIEEIKDKRDTLYLQTKDSNNNNQNKLLDNPFVQRQNKKQFIDNNNNRNDVNQKVLRTLEALFLELGAIEANKDQTGGQASVYRDITNTFHQSYPIFRVHDSLLSLPTDKSDFRSNQKYEGHQRGSNNYRLLNNVAVSSQRNWNNAYKLNTNINVENNSDISSSGQSVIDMSRMQTGSSDLFTRLSKSFEDVSRLGRGIGNSKKEEQSTKEEKVTETLPDVENNGITNETNTIQGLLDSQIAKSKVRKQAIINSSGSDFLNPFTGNNVTLPGQGKKFSDTFIARGIGNLQHVKGIEKVYPINILENVTNEKYTYIPNNKTREGDYLQKQSRLTIFGRSGQVQNSSKYDINEFDLEITNGTSRIENNATEPDQSNTDASSMIVKASILSRLFAKNDNNANIITKEVVETPIVATGIIRKDDKNYIVENLRSSSIDSSQAGDDALMSGYTGSLSEVNLVNYEQLPDSSKTPSVPTSETDNENMNYTLNTYTINLFDVNKMKQNRKSRNNGKVYQQNYKYGLQNIFLPDKYFYTQSELLKGIALNPKNTPSLQADVSPIARSNDVKEAVAENGIQCKDNEMFICNAEGKNRDIPGMVWWCFSHCKNGVCPPEKCTCRCENLITRKTNENAVKEKVSGVKRREKVIQLTLNTPTGADDDVINDQTVGKEKLKSVSINRAAESNNNIKTNNSVTSFSKTGNLDVRPSDSNPSIVPLKCKGINAFVDTTGIDELCTKMCAQNICPEAICKCL